MVKGLVFTVISEEFRGGYLQGMPDNKNIIIDPAATVGLILVFLLIVLFWGEPDMLDLILIKMGG